MTAACTEGDSSNRNVNWERPGDHRVPCFLLEDGAGKIFELGSELVTCCSRRAEIV